MTTVVAKIVDRIASRALALPRATTSYSVRNGVPITMRDGTVLLADHYEPDRGPVRGTLLVRSPYGRAGMFGLLYARPFAERGYRVISQSCRGSFGSGGAISGFAGEIEDGADTVAWLREQPWFTGRFATLGISYLGFNQWALLMDPPPEMVAAVITSGPHDMSSIVYSSGAFSLRAFATWSDLMLHQEDHSAVASLLLATVKGERHMTPLFDGLPLATVGATFFDGKAPWYGGALAHPDISDPYWNDLQLHEALQRADLPVLLFSGWQDVMLEQALEQHAALHGRGVDVHLTVGPWTHGDMATKGAGLITRDTLAFFAEHLAGDGPRPSHSPVRISVTGVDGWRDLAAWPPVTRDEVLHLQPGGGLAHEPPAADAVPSTFIYDPSDPTPTIGGLTNSAKAGRRDNAKREERADVLTFTGPPLAHDLEVIGSPVLELVHGTDNPHADVFVRLCEVDAKGRSWNVAERYVRLDPYRHEEPLRLVLSPTAHRFAAGTRLRVQVSGGSFPEQDRNLGTGEPAATATTMRPSHRTIAHGRGGVSSLTLPVA